MKYCFGCNIICNEDQIKKTIAVAKNAFLDGENNETVSCVEFLYVQSKYIKKVWWLIQGALLAVLCAVVCNVNSDVYIRRSMGVVAPMFIILIVPELWKNRRCSAMEVEGTTLYTIRQIYAARFTLFAAMDLVLLTTFFISASYLSCITLWEIMIQFVLPLNVTCCICFSTLYGARGCSEPFSVLMCSIWTGIWEFIILNDAVYNAISISIWGILLVLSFAFLGYCIYRGQKTIYRTWEVIPLWN